MTMVQYIIDVSIVWSLLYMIYHNILREDTFFQRNRIFLLSALFFGLSLPLLRSLAIHAFTGGPDSIIYPMHQFTSFDGMTPAVNTTAWDTLTIALIIYWLGVVVFTGRFMFGLWQIYRLYGQGSKIPGNNYTIVQTSSSHLPFSFGRYIFWSQCVNLPNIDPGKILLHERKHIQDGHTIDVLFLEIIKIFFWFHPLIYLYRQAITQLHEFICDAEVTASVQEITSDQTPPVSPLINSLSHHFFNIHLRERIKMIKRNPTAPLQYWKALLAMPMLVLAFVLFAFSPEPAGTPILKSCEQEGSQADKISCTQETFLASIYKSVLYAKEARGASVTGWVILGLTFDKDGLKKYKILSITDDRLRSGIDPVIEAIRYSEFIVPNRNIKFSVPIKFILEGVDKQTNAIPKPKFSATKFPSIYSDEVVVTGYLPEKEKSSKMSDNALILQDLDGLKLHQDSTPRWVNSENSQIKLTDFKTLSLDYADPTLHEKVVVPRNYTYRIFDAAGKLLFTSSHELTHLDGDDINIMNVMKSTGTVEIFLKSTYDLDHFLDQIKNVDEVLDDRSNSPTKIDANLNASKFQWQLYPNPVNGTIKLDLDSKNKEIDLSYFLSDPQGKRIGNIIRKKVPGKWSEEIDVRQLPAGQYFLVLERDGEMESRSFLVDK